MKNSSIRSLSLVALLTLSFGATGAFAQRLAVDAPNDELSRIFEEEAAMRAKEEADQPMGRAGTQALSGTGKDETGGQRVFGGEGFGGKVPFSETTKPEGKPVKPIPAQTTTKPIQKPTSNTPADSNNKPIKKPISADSKEDLWDLNTPQELVGTGERKEDQKPFSSFDADFEEDVELLGSSAQDLEEGTMGEQQGIVGRFRDRVRQAIKRVRDRPEGEGAWSGLFRRR